MSADDARVHAYLDDVARMLGSIDPADRAEILAGLREHIDAAVTGQPRPADDEAVEQVLAELGPPDRVAAAALSDLGPSPRQAPAAIGTAPRPALTQPWVPVTVGLLTVLSAGLYLVVLAASVALALTQQPEVVPPAVAAQYGTAAYGAGSFHGPAPADFVQAEVTQNPMLPASYDIVWSMLGPLGLVGLPWLVSTILLASSPLWTTRQKWAGALLMPSLAVACGAVTWLGAAVPASPARAVLVVAAGLAVTAAAVWLMARLWRDGAQRARTWGLVESGPEPARAPWRV
ncbi:HAAS signaling domain-containing protein [Georgenia daeguensis]|uniref:DUF1700 domain-containing protein n=1 Tax=Georgenia daeguensis TaxID=908355 RepID=A0ABP8EP77_9MICO